MAVDLKRAFRILLTNTFHQSILIPEHTIVVHVTKFQEHIAMTKTAVPKTGPETIDAKITSYC